MPTAVQYMGRSLAIGLIMILAQACWTMNEQGVATVVPPELVPLAVGDAVYKEVQQVELNLEFVVSDPHETDRASAP